MGFRVWGLGCRVWGLGCRVWGLGCRAWGLGCRIHRGVDVLGDAVDVDHDVFLEALGGHCEVAHVAEPKDSHHPFPCWRFRVQVV